MSEDPTGSLGPAGIAAPPPPPPSPPKPEEHDPGLQRLLAEMRRDRAAMELLDARDRQAGEQEAAAARLARLQQWAGAGFGGAPLPETPEQWEQIPEMVRARIQSDAPAVARQFVQPVPLPADTELRRIQGRLDPQLDGPLLEQSGWFEEAAGLRQQVMQQRIAAFEEGQRQAAEAAAAQQAAWEAQRLAGEQQANAAARSQWLGSVQTGQPNPLVAAAVRLGAIKPGPR